MSENLLATGIALFHFIHETRIPLLFKANPSAPGFIKFQTNCISIAQSAMLSAI